MSRDVEQFLWRPLRVGLYLVVKLWLFQLYIMTSTFLLSERQHLLTY